MYLRYCAEACNEWRAHFRGIAPGQHSIVEASQRWRAVGDTSSALTDLGFQPQSYRTDSNWANWRIVENYLYLTSKIRVWTAQWPLW